MPNLRDRSKVNYEVNNTIKQGYRLCRIIKQPKMWYSYDNLPLLIPEGPVSKDEKLQLFDYRTHLIQKYDVSDDGYLKEIFPEKELVKQVEVITDKIPSSITATQSKKANSKLRSLLKAKK